MHRAPPAIGRVGEPAEIDPLAPADTPQPSHAEVSLQPGGSAGALLPPSFGNALVRLRAWLLLFLGGAVALAVVLYAILEDRQLVEAMVTARPEEARGFDLGSLSGLASLAMGGERPNFEEFSFVVGSRTNIRQALPAIRRDAPAFAAEAARASAGARLMLGIDGIGRGLFGRQRRIEDADERLVRGIERRLRVRPTTEGYLHIELRARDGSSLQRVVEILVAQADEGLRQRAERDYRARIDTFSRLLDESRRANEQVVLSTLVGREFMTFAASQSGETFAFLWVDPPGKARTSYAPPFLLILLGLTLAAIMAWLTLVWLIVWLRRP